MASKYIYGGLSNAIESCKQSYLEPGIGAGIGNGCVGKPGTCKPVKNIQSY